MIRHPIRERQDKSMVPETYAIVLKETGLPIGSIGLHRNDLAEKAETIILLHGGGLL